MDTFAPIRERTAKILGDPAALDAVLLDGGRRAREIAGRDDGRGAGPLRPAARRLTQAGARPDRGPAYPGVT